MIKRRLLSIFVPVIILVIAGIIIYTLFGFHAELINKAHKYEPASITKSPYVLETVKKEDSSGVYASFIIKNEATDSVIFECADTYRTFDLKSITWAEANYDIIVVSGDVGTIKYYYKENSWVKI